MELIADGLLILAALCASLYCLVLSRRLRRLNRLDNGLGGAIASLSTQVDEMHRALAEAKQVTERSKRELDSRTKRAEQAAGRLELLLVAVREPRSEDKAGAGEAAASAAESAEPPTAPATSVEPLAEVAEAEPEPETAQVLSPDPAPAIRPAKMETPEPPASVPEANEEPAVEAAATVSSADREPEELGASIAVQPRNAAEPEPTRREPEQETQTPEVLANAIDEMEDRADDELRLAEAIAHPDQSLSAGESGISEELLQALDKMAGRAAS
ncbi:MAG: hypothetical protein AAF415_16150 [Pseudomonadota bacterium]